jgi:hypothetical protein
MKQVSGILCAVLACGVGAALAADQPGTVGRVYVNFAKPGMTAQYEAGRKKHMEWHRKQGDSWTWNVWQIETGERAGAYLVATTKHHWKDLDDWEKKLGDADGADAQVNLVPFTGSGANGIYNLLLDVSHPTEGDAVPPMAELVRYQVKVGGEAQFLSATKKIKDAILKSGSSWHWGWWELVDGGEHPEYVLVFAMQGWADLAPPETPFPALLAKAYGEYEAGQILSSINDSVKSVRSEVIRYRPDLSYVPSAK